MGETEPEPAREVSDDIVDKPRGGRGGCVVGCLFGVLVLYVLSPPLVLLAAVAAIEAGWGPAEAIEEATVSVTTVVYAPLQWLYDNVEPVKKFYDWYQSLFERWLSP